MFSNQNYRKCHFKREGKGEPSESYLSGFLQLAPKWSSSFSSKLILESTTHPLGACFLCAVFRRTCLRVCSLSWYRVVGNKSSTSASALITVLSSNEPGPRDVWGVGGLPRQSPTWNGNVQMFQSCLLMKLGPTQFLQYTPHGVAGG